MSETTYNIDSIPTFVVMPFDTLDSSGLQKPDQFRIIKNPIIKTLSNGSLCIIDTNDLPFQNSAISSELPPQCLLESPIIYENEANQTPVHSPPVYKCSKCKEEFEKITLYRKHVIGHRQIKKYKCEKCSAGYNVETNLKIHMAMHAEGKPSCPLCNISFQRLASLKSHMMLHQVEELYTCEDCAAEFEKEEEYSKHLLSHVNTVQENNNLICSYCNVQFDESKTYKEHISHHVKIKKMVLSGKKSRKTHGNKEYPHVCSVCLKSFSRASLLERHLRVHSGERPFVCPHCSRGFNQKGTLQIHLSKHTGIKPFHCTLCSAKFNQKGNLRVHVEKTHTAPVPGVKTYKCSHCTCIFKKVASLNVHITKSHANNEDVGNIASVMTKLKELEEQTSVTPKEVAEQNKKVLDNIKENNELPHTSYVRLAESFLDGTVRRYLVMQKKQNDVRLYVCSYCNKEFKKPSDLIRHTRVHTREKPFMCKQCGASFALKSTLFCHIKTHIGSNNYFCVICTKKFSSMRSVNLHLRKHSEKQSQQYKCTICNKWFSSLHRVKLHNRESHGEQQKDAIVVLKQPLVHTPNGLLPVSPPKPRTTGKQFQCSDCGARFNKMANLNRHALLHGGERKFKCEQCLKTYLTAHALKEHALAHAGIRNYGCKVCGKRYTTASLLKRHTISHNTHKPYLCPYCKKSFKSVMLCRKHMNVHKKEISLQVHSLDETGKIQSLDESDREKQLGTSGNDKNLDFVQREGLDQTHDINKQTQLITQETNKVQPVADQEEQQLYQVTPSSVQIITSSDKDKSQYLNQTQTILINCDSLQVTENLYSQNADGMLFCSLGDNQDFSLNDWYGDLVPQNPEANTSDQTFNINQMIPSEQADSLQTKTKNEKFDVVPNSTDNVSYYTQSDLNLLLNLDSDFESNNLNLPDINLNEVPVLNADTPQPAEEKKKLSCDKCRKTFTNQNSYAKHVNAHKKTGGSPRHCSFCSKAFKKQSDLVRHIRTHTGEKPFPCDKCDKRFSLKSTLLSHQRTHNPVSHKRHNCVVCNSFFTSKSSLKVHMSVHTGDKTFECSSCAMRFRTAAHRKIHETTHHSNPSKKRPNTKVTSLLASVAMDALNHQDQVVLSNDQLTDQLQLPADQLTGLTDNSNPLTEPNHLEPIILQQLQSNFLLTDNLIPSSLIQLDDGTLLNFQTVNDFGENAKEDTSVTLPAEKPRNLECEVCHKKYASKDVLRKHRKIHGVNKKFPCSKCDKGFDIQGELEKHQKVHDGHRPYPCLYCTNSFAKENSLATHMKRIHDISLKDNPLLCDFK